MLRGILKMKYKSQYLGLVLITFLTSVASSFTGVYLSIFLKNDLMFTNEQIGFYFSVSSIFNVCISMLLAYISDKSLTFRRLSIYVGLFSAGIGYYLYIINNSFFSIMMISITFIAISSCITPQIFALASDILRKCLLNENEILSKLTFLRTTISFSYIVGPLIGAVILSDDHFSYLYFGASMIYFLSLIFIFIFYRNKKIEDAKNEIKNKEQFTNYKLVISMFILFVLIQTVHSIISNVIPIFLTNIKEYSNNFVGMIASYSAMLEVPLLCFWAYLIIKFELKRMLYFGIFSGLVFLSIVYLSDSISITFFSYLFNAIFYTITIGLGMPFFQHIIPHSQGMATTLFINTSSIGKICCGIILNCCTTDYRSIFLITIIVIIISLFILLKTDVQVNDK